MKKITIKSASSINGHLYALGADGNTYHHTSINDATTDQASFISTMGYILASDWELTE